MKKYWWTVLPLAAMLLTGCQRQEDSGSFQEGMTAIENKDYRGAIEDFDVAISLQEDETASYRGKGIAYMGLGDYEKAVEAFDSALSLVDEKMPNTKRDLLYYKASALYRAENYDDTIEVCTAILDLNKEGDAYYLRGACYMAADEFDRAKLDFDNAAALSPNDYDLFLNIYGCYLDKNRSADGDVYLEKALTIQDTTEEGSYQKARIYYYLEDYEKAQALLNSLVEKKNERAMELMGKVYLAMDDTAHARKTYQELIEAHGESTASYNGLVLCDLKDENYDSALDNITRGIKAPGDEGRQELMYNAIVVWEHQGDFEKAKEKAQEYVELYPADEKGMREYTFLSTR